MKILVLNGKDIQQVITMKKALQADKDALLSYSQGQCTTPFREVLDIPKHNVQSLFIPGYDSKSQALGVKVVCVYLDNMKRGLSNVPSTMLLINPETGEVCSITEGTTLTRLRTGVVYGLATQILSRENSQVFALFGTGDQAQPQVEAILCVRQIQEVRLFDLNFQRCKDSVTIQEKSLGKTAR